MLRLPIPHTSQLTCGGWIARRFHCLSRPFYDFGVRCEKIAVPQRPNEYASFQSVLYISHILP
jgi:hypothetical protein